MDNEKRIALQNFIFYQNVTSFRKLVELVQIHPWSGFADGRLQSIQCVIWNCEAKIVVNEIDPGQQRYKVTESFIRTFREKTRSDATSYVKRLLVPTSNSYQLLFNNCRDHHDRAINGLCRDGQCRPKGKEEALRNTQARRIGDAVLGFGIFGGVVSLIGYVLRYILA